jgi:hypothetical protein
MIAGGELGRKTIRFFFEACEEQKMLAMKLEKLENFSPFD